MLHSEFSWLTQQGIKIFGQIWQPESGSAPKAVVALAHGLGEHSSRYVHVGDFFALQGIATVAYDRQGHGRSEGTRGHVADYEHFLDEVQELVRQAETRFPNLPIILYGHSMGGNIALNYALRRRPTNIKALIATSPIVTLAFTPPPIMIMLGKLTRKIYPKFTQKNQVDATALSRYAQVGIDYTNDPLVHDSLTSAAGLGILEYAEWLTKNAGKVPFPFLLMHGTADRVTNSEGTKWFAENYTGDVTLKLWDGYFHEMHNDIGKEAVMQYAVDFILKKI